MAKSYIAIFISCGSCKAGRSSSEIWVSRCPVVGSARRECRARCALRTFAAMEKRNECAQREIEKDDCASDHQHSCNCCGCFRGLSTSAGLSAHRVEDPHID